MTAPEQTSAVCDPCNGCGWLDDEQDVCEFCDGTGWLS